MAGERHSRVAVRAAVALGVTAAAFLLVAWLAPDSAYLWIKALHVIAVISWMAGMLYLPRLFVNHVGLPVGSAESELLKGMEQRLLTIIINPAMALSWFAGLWLAWYGRFYLEPWFLVKFVLVLLLSGFRDHLARSVRIFARDQNLRTARYWRFTNEVPALLMIGIVVMVIVKPF